MSNVRATPGDGPAAYPGRKVPNSRAEVLRAMLPYTLECLKSRRASLIGDDLIADYVALDWLEWAGGGLRATDVGRNVCDMVIRHGA